MIEICRIGMNVYFIMSQYFGPLITSSRLRSIESFSLDILPSLPTAFMQVGNMQLVPVVRTATRVPREDGDGFTLGWSDSAVYFRQVYLPSF